MTISPRRGFWLFNYLFSVSILSCHLLYLRIFRLGIMISHHREIMAFRLDHKVFPHQEEITHYAMGIMILHPQEMWWRFQLKGIYGAIALFSRPVCGFWLFGGGEADCFLPIFYENYTKNKVFNLEGVSGCSTIFSPPDWQFLAVLAVAQRNACRPYYFTTLILRIKLQFRWIFRMFGYPPLKWRFSDAWWRRSARLAILIILGR